MPDEPAASRSAPACCRSRRTPAAVRPHTADTTPPHGSGPNDAAGLPTPRADGQRDSRTGIDHALAAIGWADQTDDARLQAYAYDVAACAYAMDRQGQATSNAIDRARSALAAADDRADTYAYFLSAGQLGSTESVCYLQLGHADKGIEAAERSLAGIDGSFVRNLALTSLRLGICHLRREEPDIDRAAAAIADAARLASHNRVGPPGRADPVGLARATAMARHTSRQAGPRPDVLLRRRRLSGRTQIIQAVP